jgi:hypothetical protein
MRTAAVTLYAFLDAKKFTIVECWEAGAILGGGRLRGAQGKKRALPFFSPSSQSLEGFFSDECFSSVRPCGSP